MTVSEKLILIIQQSKSNDNEKELKKQLEQIKEFNKLNNLNL